MADETFPGFDTADIELDDNLPEENYNLRAPSFDYEEMKTKVNSVGEIIVGNAQDAYRFWVMKCLITERYNYLAYSSDFGVEIEEIQKANYPRDIAESEIQRTITESLEIDERTTGVENFQFDWDGDSLFITFEVDSIYGLDTFEYRRGGDDNARIRVQAS